MAKSLSLGFVNFEHLEYIIMQIFDLGYYLHFIYLNVKLILKSLILDFNIE